MKWYLNVKAKVFTDGGARGNPGPAAVGFVVMDKETGKLIKSFGKKVGVTTNNVAEYLAVIEALNFLKKEKIFQAEFFLDSQLVVSQLNGIFRIKNFRLRNLIVKVRELEAGLGGNISYHLIPREKNWAADKLVNSSLV